MSTLLQDLRYALRALVQRPLYVVVTAGALALAIGANTTVFSIVDAFLLRPLPYPDQERIVAVYNTYPKMDLEVAGTSIPDYLDRRDRAESLDALTILTMDARALGGDGPPEQLVVTRASPSFFDVFGTSPVLGRGFSEDEATPGNERVVVLSNALWRTRFGGDPGVVGREIRLDGTSYRVIGVMPEGFGFPSTNVDAWVPFAFTPALTGDDQRGMEFSQSFGKLRPGASTETLNAEFDRIVRRNIESGRIDDGEGFIEVTGFTGRAVPLRDMRIGDIDQALLLLQAIVLAVLLIACANVANFQLARMAARRRELSVRTALGARRGRLVRLVTIESLLLAAIGGAAGLLIARGGLVLLQQLGLDASNQGFEFALDGRVLLFTLGCVLLAGILSAVLPLFAMLRDDLIRAVHEAGRLGSAERSAQGLRSALVVVQVAVSLALLIGAGLLAKSFYQLEQRGAGFDGEGVWTAFFALPATRYGDPGTRAGFIAESLESLGALPGVAAAGFTSVLPFSGNNAQGSVDVDGYTPPPGVSPPHAQLRTISEDYFATLGIPLLAGRGFSSNEADRVVIIDENMAEAFWPGGSAIGGRLREDVGAADVWYTVVGVVPSIRHASLAEDSTDETVYWHYRQRPGLRGALTLRSTLPVDTLTTPATAAIAGIDPDIALFNIVPMSRRIRDSLGQQLTPMALTLVFAATALTLAIIGVYGVLTWAVTQRVGEIGVRMALGAQTADIVRMVLRQGGRLIVTGLVVGAVLAVLLGRLMSSQIYDVSPADPVVFIAGLGVLAAAGFLASWMPARRASRIDPMTALREE